MIQRVDEFFVTLRVLDIVMAICIRFDTQYPTLTGTAYSVSAVVLATFGDLAFVSIYV
jgi:hypothetical protein